MDKFEITIVKYFNDLGSKRMDIWLSFLNSIPFLSFFWSALAVVAILRHPEITKSFLIAIVLVALLHFGITELLMKHLLLFFVPKRKRPFAAFPKLIRSVGKKFSDSSFPSSHMATTVAMLFVIVSFYPSLFLCAATFVLLMAFSRLHNGMHYPSDILAGIMLGFFYGWLAFKLLVMIV